MSTVNIIYNLDTQTWSSETDALTSNYCNLQIGFTTNAQRNVTFNKLTFGYDLRDKVKIVQRNQFPEDFALEYRNTTERFLVSEPLNLLPSTSYSVTLWVKNDGKESKYRYSFKTPDNTDTGHYENSSVPHPDNENAHMYKFDEKTRTWVKK